MKLRDYTLEVLAEMVTGDHAQFPYRSGPYITSFFRRCDLDWTHDGTTRKWWTKSVLEKLNLGPCPAPDLPASAILRIVSELFEPDDFDRRQLSRDDALDTLNSLLTREGLAAYFDNRGRCFVRRTGTGTSSASLREPRPLSREEIAARQKVEAFLEQASEDEFTERILVPL